MTLRHSAPMLFGYSVPARDISCIPLMGKENGPGLGNQLHCAGICRTSPAGTETNRGMGATQNGQCASPDNGLLRSTYLRITQIVRERSLLDT